MPAPEVAGRLVDLAVQAHARGDALLHLQLEVGQLGGPKSSWGSSENALTGDDSTGYFLSSVEQLGWRLEHTGYSFVEFGSSSSARVLSTGQGTVNHGSVVGCFTFRRIDSPVPPAD